MPWPVADNYDAVVCINMIHIAPWAATPALLKGARSVLREDGPGLLVGGYEPDTIAFGNTGIPSPFQRQLFEPNYDRWAQLHELADLQRAMLDEAAEQGPLTGVLHCFTSSLERASFTPPPLPRPPA